MTKALIVDDKDENVQYLTSLLGGQGWVIRSARNGMEALEAARTEPPDLVISDLLMPVMDGYTLLRHWKADPLLSSTPFVVYTATYTQEEDADLAHGLGADAFILKPTEPAAFLETVQGVLGGNSVRRTPRASESGSETTMEVYSKALIRKLEQRTAQLEEMNKALQLDIAERRAAEAALKETRELYSGLVQSVDGIVWEADATSWQFNFVSDRAKAMLGYEVQEWLNKPNFWIEHLHPDDRGAALEICKRSTDAKEGHTFEYRMIAADGRDVWLRDIVSYVSNGGKPLLRGIMLDITDRKKAGESAALLAQRLTATIESITDAFITIDREWRFTYVNSEAERQVKKSRHDMLGNSLWDVFTDLRGTEFETQYTRAMNENVSVNFEAYYPGLKAWFVIRAYPSQEGLAIYFQDVTHSKQVEAQLLRAQRLESIGTLAGGIAHDLNNVLAPITMAIDVLRPALHDQEDLDTLDLLESSAKRGALMVAQVLSFARGVEGKRVALQVAHSVNEVRTIVKDTFPKNIGIVERLQPDLWAVEADPTQLHQVLLNLCVNSRDAMPAGGEITISASNVELSAAAAAANIDAKPGAYVRVDVADTGAGIPLELIDKIFDPFFTTKEIGKGTGLGLSTTLSIVRGHGGFVQVSSTPEQGSCFSVHFPALMAVSHPGTQSGARHSKPGSGETVLIVDDEAAIRRITQRTLERNGYRVLAASNGVEALEVFEVRGSEISLAVIDMMMPVMDGPATARALLQKNPSLPIIGVSGVAPQVDAEPQLKMFSVFLIKPYGFDTLLSAVAQLLSRPQS